MSAEPPTYDAHAEEGFGLLHPFAPFYSTLLRIDPTDPSGTRVIGDLAKEWTVSVDGLTYTFQLRPNVRFHDGSTLTARDVKASYDRIVFPPPGIVSRRWAQYSAIQAIEAPDLHTVRFRLRHPSASLLPLLASPHGWIYSADILARNQRWYETHVMGSGPFKFVEHVRGSHVLGLRNPAYWDPSKPYLDAFRALMIPSGPTQIAALRGERIHAQFRGVSPQNRDTLVAALGDRIRVQESPWNCVQLVIMNHERPPFGDSLVRRALTLALDRDQASRVLPRMTVLKQVGGLIVAGNPYAMPAEQLMRLAGYGHDIHAARAEARRLLRAAGAEALPFTLTTRAITDPFEATAIWLLDQWRQVGVQAQLEVVEASEYHPKLRRGMFEVAFDSTCGDIVDPDITLAPFLSAGRNPRNYGRYEDPVLDELYERQSRALDPHIRQRHVWAFERRMLDEETHVLVILQSHRIVVHSVRMRGWQITPSHFLNQQLDGVWLAQ